MGKLTAAVQEAQSQTGMVAVYEVLLSMAEVIHDLQDKVTSVEQNLADNQAKDEEVKATLAQIVETSGIYDIEDHSDVIDKIKQILAPKVTKIEVIQGDTQTPVPTPEPVAETPAAPTEPATPAPEPEPVAA